MAKGIAITICSLIFFTTCEWDYVEPVETREVSFSNDIIPLFEQSCTTCHSPGAVSPDLTAANAYDELFSNNLIDTLNPEGSVLYVRMNSNVDPMPPSGKLPSAQVSLVLNWIEQGAKNN